jgi:hypothetical protein
MGRIGVIAADPNPLTVDPFIVAGNPNRAAIGRRPSMFEVGRRGRTSDLNVDIDARGGPARACERENSSRATERDRTKRSYFHILS